MGAQAVVKAHQLTDGIAGYALEETPEGGLIREAVEAQHVQEGAVVLEDVGLVDTAQTHDDTEHEGQDKFRGMKGGASLGAPNISLQEASKAQFVAKALDQPHPTEVSEMGFVEEKLDLAGIFWHVTQNTLLGSFVSRAFYKKLHRQFPSVKHRFPCSGQHGFTLF